MSTTDNPSIDQKLDMLMEAVLLQQKLLQQVLLSYDKLLQKLIVVQKPIDLKGAKLPNDGIIFTPSKEIIK